MTCAAYIMRLAHQARIAGIHSSRKGLRAGGPVA